MIGSQAKSPLQILVNYWELQSGEIGPHLDELLQSGASHLVTFVPWQALEADISHAFSRFLQALTDRRMTVSLIVTPEMAIHYPNSGLPKDLISRAEGTAQHFQKGPIIGALPPNQFPLPSLLSADFTRRYFSFLARIDTILADFERTSGRSLDHVTLILTGSYWKYYRSPAGASGPFSRIAGDFSAAASVQYRQRLDEFYGQPEFTDPSPAASARWKTQALEETNRRWFAQQCEVMFRNRTLQFARKKARSVRIQEVELFAPEADPSLTYHYFLQAVSGRSMDFARLSALLDEIAAFGSMGGLSAAPTNVLWSSLGGFRGLSEPERQFLMLKSLLSIGGRGGSVLIDEEEWFAFSRGFRHRVESFSRVIAQGDLRLKNRALYLSSHLWSGPGALWRELSRRVGHGARKIASIGWALADREASLLMVDPSFVMTKEAIEKLTQWVSSSPDTSHGRVLAIPRTTLYTERARAYIEQISAGSKKMELNLGVSYRVHSIGDGKLVIYDVQDANYCQELSGKEWDAFMASLLSLAEVREDVLVSDSRISVIPLERHDFSTGLFVLNGSPRQVTADIIFSSAVSVSDLALEVSASGPAFAERERSSAIEPARRFTLEVPHCGILPLSVDRVGAAATSEERIAADQLAGVSRENALAAAIAELPGLAASGDQESVWN